MFLTGEFSQISRVSKRLLHYYDEIGLLKPAHIDPPYSLERQRYDRRFSKESLACSCS